MAVSITIQFCGATRTVTGSCYLLKLILDINDRVEAAADDRARGVIIRKLRRALEERP